LILSGNTLYGTAYGGGSSGKGTVFKVNTDGTGFTPLYSFTGSDGANPYAGLILSSNTLYGTAVNGGSSSSSHGTVFAVNTNGTGFTTLHSFTNGSDGYYPYAGLILSGNTLYGTAVNGGNGLSYGWGTVFAGNTDGTGFTRLHYFTGGSDGADPYAFGGLILSGNTLYGTAYYGGSSGDGTVFAVNTDGTGFTILHSFTGYSNSTNSDGYYPVAGLILSGNTLYGTATHGGSANAGTVFAVNTNGTGFTTLHSFTASSTNSLGIYTNSDGYFPDAGLILSGNTLYGTAFHGGSSGQGTVFAVNTDGTGFTILHSFTGGSDGTGPDAGLILSGNTLYGTAYGGGSSGKGTVFSLTLPGFFIVPAFDSSILNDPNGPAMMAAINAAAQVFHTNISDNFTVYIKYVNDPTKDLAESSTWGGSYSYAAYLAALKNSAVSVNDTKAISQLPNSATDPVIGDNNIYLTKALARHMGLALGEGSDGFDSTISLNMTLMNFTRPPTVSTNYDLQATIEHENDEVLGTSSGLPDASPIWAMDLFRYTTNLNRTYTTNGDNAYFSVDGTNLWARFNMHPLGDYADWWSAFDTNRWALPGTTPHPQVQDAFGNPGTVQDLGINELAMLDIVGWTLFGNVTQPTAPALAFVSSSAGQITISWPNNVSGYVLQESTSLTPGSWATAATGSTNPAVILTTATKKFYRLYKAATPSIALAKTAAVQLSKSTSDELKTRVFRPRQP
jgi:uncharacterized repeat protein (TIGR03803 family)